MPENETLEIIISHCKVNEKEKNNAEKDSCLFLIKKRIKQKTKITIACPINNEELTEDKGIVAHWPIYGTIKYIREKLEEQTPHKKVFIVSKSVWKTLKNVNFNKERILYVDDRLLKEELVDKLSKWIKIHLNEPTPN